MLIFEKQKNKYIESYLYIFFQAQHERGENIRVFWDEKPDVRCCAGEVGCPGFGLRPTTMYCRVQRLPCTQHPSKGPMHPTQQHSPSRQLPLAGIYESTAPERIQPQSALPSVTLPHPTPDASSNEAKYQHHFAAVGG